MIMKFLPVVIFSVLWNLPRSTIVMIEINDDDEFGDDDSDGDNDPCCNFRTLEFSQVMVVIDEYLSIVWSCLLTFLGNISA